MHAGIIITIDGPAGTGKSSVARELARRLGLDFLDTGAMYRAATAIALDAEIATSDTDRLVARVQDADIHFDWTVDPPAVLAWMVPLDNRIRDRDVTEHVSEVAAIAPLRDHMVRKQRLIAAQHPRLVTEGRDQGSVVFPDAAVKIYLDAEPEVRARRRAHQLARESEPIESLIAELERRDRLDAGRRAGPLIQPPDAAVIDTTRMSFTRVVDLLEHQTRERIELP